MKDIHAETKFLCCVTMDRSWMNGSWISDLYDNDIEEFLQFV